MASTVLLGEGEGPMRGFLRERVRCFTHEPMEELSALYDFLSEHWRRIYGTDFLDAATGT